VASIKIKHSLKKKVKSVTRRNAHTNKHVSQKKRILHISKSKLSKKTKSVKKNKIIAKKGNDIAKVLRWANKKNKPGKKELFFTNVKRNVGQDFCFVLSNGNNLYSLKELALELDNMADDVFYFHVNESKNDFQNWIRDVIKDEELCVKIGKAKDAKEMQIFILKHIVKEL
jgi:hypothetical protein